MNIIPPNESPQVDDKKWDLFSTWRKERSAKNRSGLRDEKFQIMADFSYNWEAWILPNGRFEYISPSCELITGYSQAEFMAEPELLLKITHPDDREMVAEHFKQHLSPKAERAELEFRIITKNNTDLRWICHKCSPVTLKTGEWQGRRISNRDITKKRRQEREKLETSQLQSELQRVESLKTMAGAIAHRFNNSMMAVLGNLELFEMITPPETAGRENVSDALQAAREVAQIGSAMLTYIDQRRVQLNTSNLVEHVKEYFDKLKNQPRPLISFSFTPPLEPLYCSIDSQQINEVISGVFNNAIESLEGTSGTIEISFGTEKYETSSFPIFFQSEDLKNGLYSFCQIKDSGKGINKEELPRIFEPFFTTKFVGRGLGLALAGGIMRAHHGSINITSIIGQGTTVRILLPTITKAG